MGYGIEASTLDKAATEAQRCPYFLQIIGEELHLAAKTEPGKLESGNKIGNAILEQAIREFHSKKNKYYAERYQELETQGILRPAEAVARLFASQKKKSISTNAIVRTVSDTIDKNLKKIAKENGAIVPTSWVVSELRHAGIIWSRIGHEHACEPGIPSLMNYVVKRAASAA